MMRARSLEAPLSRTALCELAPLYLQHNGVCGDLGRCPVQCGPAGRAAPARPAAMHRAAAILSHVPGTSSVESGASFISGVLHTRCCTPSCVLTTQMENHPPPISYTQCISEFMLYKMANAALYDF